MILYIKIIFNTFFNLFRRKDFLKAYKGSITLRSMQKSGTNYLRLLLSNYLYNLENANKGEHNYEEINYDKMHSSIYPNIRDYVFLGDTEYIPSKVNMEDKNNEKYTDFMYDHYCVLDKQPIPKFIRSKKLILIYRNPLDVLISRFFYFYKNRNGNENMYDHPRDIISKYMPNYIKTYKWMKRYSTNNSHVVLVTYEELKEFPKETITIILNHLNINIYPELIEFAIHSSSIKKVRQIEKERGGAIHAPSVGINQSFARSGSIGQWKDYFDEKDISQINSLLNKRGVDLEEFTLEPVSEKK